MAVLTNREKKFLANAPKMRKIFANYASQAGVAYEYCRAYEAEKPLFERFGQVRLKFLSGYVKKSTQKTSARVKICNTNFDKLTSTRFAIQKNQKNQKNSENSEKLEKSRTNSPQKSGFEVRFSDPYDIVAWNKIIYHEMAHNLIKKTVRELDRVVARRVKNSKRGAKNAEMICFSGVDPIYSYAVGRQGQIDKVIWRNLPLKMLEEGVAENIAMNCLENECALGDGSLFLVADKSCLMNKIQGKITHYIGYSLVGLWDCVSNNSLIREHLTGGSDDGELAEATEIFKNKFVDFAQLVVGKNEENATPQNYDSGKMREIASRYSNCVDFCKKRYLLLFGTREQNENLRAFGGFVEVANNVPNVVRNLSQYINMTAREVEETREIFNKVLRLNAWQIEKQKSCDVEQDCVENGFVVVGASNSICGADAVTKSVETDTKSAEPARKVEFFADNFEEKEESCDAVDFEKIDKGDRDFGRDGRFEGEMCKVN